jgi:hypothetical protein
MISLGRRGAVPKDQQVKAIHIECDSEIPFELKVALSKIYASAMNDNYPNGIRMRLVPDINSMISPDTRQNDTRLRARLKTISNSKSCRLFPGIYPPWILSTLRSEDRSVTW